MKPKSLFQLLKNNRVPDKKKKNIRISRFAYIHNCEFAGYNYVDRFCKMRNVQMGKYSYVGFNSDFNQVQIGNYCSIASDVKIGLGHHPTEFVSTSPVFYSSQNPFGLQVNKITYDVAPRKTIIENDVWIGANVIIMDGVQIGNGAVIASGSVVTKDVADYAIVGGVPAKIIRMRFDEATIQRLSASKWWEKEAAALIQTEIKWDDPKNFPKG